MRKAELKSKISTLRSFGDRDGLILASCKGRSVLDVGCVGQARKRDSEDWLHGRLETVASELIGVDTDRQGVEDLRRQGHAVLLPEQLDGRKFERIVMGDVIEHVGNPVPFLEFYAAHLAKDGRIVLTTPNAFSAVQFLHIAARNRVWVNSEHVCFFDPITLAETVERAGLEVVEVVWLKTRWLGPVNMSGRMLRAVAALAGRIRPYFAEDFFVELAPRSF